MRRRTLLETMSPTYACRVRIAFIQPAMWQQPGFKVGGLCHDSVKALNWQQYCTVSALKCSDSYFHDNCRFGQFCVTSLLREYVLSMFSFLSDVSEYRLHVSTMSIHAG